MFSLVIVIQNEISMELFIGPLNDLTGNITKLIEDFEK